MSKVICPKCGKSLKTLDTSVDVKARCPACKTIVMYRPRGTATPAAKEPAAAAAPVEPVESAKSAISGIKQTHERYGMPNYAEYIKYTKAHNWKAICQLNNVDLYSQGTKKELKVFPNYLEDDEVVFAMTSGHMGQTVTSNASDSGINTWLIALTSERFLLLDHALLTRSVDTQSIRRDRVQAVSASQGWIFGKIMIDLGSRIVVVDNCPKAAVSAMASVANKWISALQKKKDMESAGDSVKGGSSPLDELKKLTELHSLGTLTDDEFTTAKAKLLASM